MTVQNDKSLRILVTGSRDWPDDWSIDTTLAELLTEIALSEEHATKVTLVHGGCTKGADRIANDYFQVMAETVPSLYSIEVHEAEWEKHGKRAGFVRNAKMVELGADFCVAFIKNDSRGASMTLRMAEKAGIPCLVLRLSEGETTVRRPPSRLAKREKSAS